MMEGKCLIFKGGLILANAFLKLVNCAAIVVYPFRWSPFQRSFRLFQFFLLFFRKIIPIYFIVDFYAKGQPSPSRRERHEVNYMLLLLVFFLLPFFDKGYNSDSCSLGSEATLVSCKHNDIGIECEEPRTQKSSINTSKKTTANCPGTPSQNIIEGTVFEDLDGDGVLDVGETGESGIEVILYLDNNQDGLVDGGDTPVTTLMTDNNGYYSYSPSLLGSTQNFQVSIASNSNDAEENVSTGSVNLTSSDLEMVYDGGTQQIIGMRFQNINIPQGAVIQNAVVEFYADGNNSSSTSLILYAQDIDNASVFTNSNFNISNRTKTTASVGWSSIPAWTDNATYQTPNMDNIVQEIVDRAGWISGNSMVIIVEGTSGTRRAESFDGSGGPEAKLIIDYAVYNFPAHFVMAIDPATLPSGAFLTTDNVESSIFTATGETECENDFGYVKTADVSLLKSTSLANPNIGDTVIFSLKVVNEGPGPTLGIVVTDTLNATLTYVSSNGDGSYNPATYLWAVPDIPNGDSAILNIKAIVNVVGTFGNTAQVYSSTLNDPDSTPGNNVPSEDDQSSLTITVSCAVIKKNLMMVKN